MLLLAIETTGPFASVAVADESGAVREICSDQKMNHLKGLTAMIAELLGEGGLSLSDIACIAASEGPGSFTGIRIGVSAARALAQAGNIPAVGVPTLAGFVYRLPAYRGVVCPVFDARRGQVYCGLFRLGDDGGPVTLLDGAARTPAELGRALEGFDWGAQQDVCAREICFFGDGIDACGDLLADLRAAGAAGPDVRIAPLESRFQNAASAARLALYRLRTAASASAGDARAAECAPFAGAARSYAALLPVYMRKPEAERKLEEALQSAAERKRTE
jgi:tRNA threonylcarbamoyladenosine biosynthesis protein TsaB